MDITVRNLLDKAIYDEEICIIDGETDDIIFEGEYTRNDCEIKDLKIDSWYLKYNMLYIIV